MTSNRFYTKTVYRNSAHFLPVNIDSFEKNELIAKFDTGAGATIIGISKLFPRYDIVVNDKNEQKKINDELQNKIYYLLQKYKTKMHPFISATGHSLLALPVHINNARIGNINMPIFYYWLAVQLDIKKFLLGDDFGCFCDYSHKCNESIIISDFYFDKYNEYNKKRCDSIVQDEISELINNM